MPWHDIGMMLHDRENDLVASLDALASKRIGDQVDRLGGITREDDFFFAAGIEERSYGFPRRLVSLRGFVGQIMQTAMHIGVLLGIGLLKPVQHGRWFLRRGSI